MNHYRKRLICREQKKFARCFLSGTRQMNSLPGARPGGTRQIKASGKASFAGCRHSANSSRRQKIVFAGCRTLGKIWPPAKVAGLTAASCRHPLPGATPSCDHMSRCLGFRQSTSQLARNFLNFLSGHPAKKFKKK